MKGSSETETETALLFKKRDGIATLTLNRPAAHNALTAAMFLDMERILIEIEADDEVRVLETPEVFDITRKPNPHLAFGTGTHFCMGSHIARLEMRVTLEEFLRRFPNVRLTGPPERLRSNFISGIKRLPISLA